MKKIYQVFGMLLLMLIMTSCELKFGQSTNIPSQEITSGIQTGESSIPAPTSTPSTGSLSSQEQTGTNGNNQDVLFSRFSDAINVAESTDYLTIFSNATITDKELNILKSTRTTHVDEKKKYSYSELANGKYIYYDANKYVLSSGGFDKTITYSGKKFVYTSLGLSFLFENMDFQNQNSFTIDENSVSFKYYGDLEKDIYENVNYDYGTSYKYNNYSYMEIQLFYSTLIDKIVINLSRGFASYVTSVLYEFTFSYESFGEVRPEKSYDETFKLPEPSADEKLESYVIEMNYEYGDSIFIHYGDFDMLIDAGQPEDGPYIDQFLQEHCEDGVLDVLVVTHAHADHYGGITRGALNSIDEIKLIVDYGYAHTNTYETIKRNYIKKGTQYHPVYNCVNGLDGASKLYRFTNKLSLEFIDTGLYAIPNTYLDSGANPNEYSVVCRVDYGSNSYLYTGDLAGDYEDVMLKENIHDMTVYKVAHHGARSYNSNSSNLLEYVNPDIALVSAAIISTGGKDAFTQDHPTKTVVNRILKLPKISKTKNLYYNGTMGTIMVLDDGVHLPTVTGLGPQKGYYYKGQKVTGEENKKYIDTVMYANR